MQIIAVDITGSYPESEAGNSYVYIYSTTGYTPLILLVSLMFGREGQTAYRHCLRHQKPSCRDGW